MKKTLTQNSDLVLFFNNRYPYKSQKVSKKSNTVVLGIGGNVGNTKRIFLKLFRMFQNDSRFFIHSTSPVLKNPPFGFLDQNDFFNAIVVLQTDLSPYEVLRAMQRYENRFKRKRSFKDAPRTLDIDMVFFNQLKFTSENLTIPHPCYQERDSVMIPLKFVLSA